MKFIKTYWAHMLYGIAAGLALGLVKFSNSHNPYDLFVWSLVFAPAFALAAYGSDWLRGTTSEFDSEEPYEMYSTEDAPPPAPKKAVVVRINACDFEWSWYYDREGELFEVEEFDKDMYITKGRKPDAYIRKVDCTVIS